MLAESKQPFFDRAEEDWTVYFEKTKQQAMPWKYSPYDRKTPFFQQMLALLPLLPRSKPSLRPRQSSSKAWAFTPVCLSTRTRGIDTVVVLLPRVALDPG